MPNEFEFEFAEQDQTFEFEFEEPTINFTLEQAIEITHNEYYQGEYVVTPKMFEGTVLLTKDKTMVDDVTVLEVPFYEVTNETGGTTVYIATEGYNE